MTSGAFQRLPDIAQADVLLMPDVSSKNSNRLETKLSQRNFFLLDATGLISMLSIFVPVHPV